MVEVPLEHGGHSQTQLGFSPLPLQVSVFQKGFQEVLVVEVKEVPRILLDYVLQTVEGLDISFVSVSP